MRIKKTVLIIIFSLAPHFFVSCGNNPYKRKEFQTSYLTFYHNRECGIRFADCQYRLHSEYYNYDESFYTTFVESFDVSKNELLRNEININFVIKNTSFFLKNSNGFVHLDSQYWYKIESNYQKIYLNRKKAAKIDSNYPYFFLRMNDLNEDDETAIINSNYERITISIYFENTSDKEYLIADRFQNIYLWNTNQNMVNEKRIIIKEGSSGQPDYWKCDELRIFKQNILPGDSYTKKDYKSFDDVKLFKTIAHWSTDDEVEYIK